jgi:hypothetical protein
MGQNNVKSMFVGKSDGAANSGASIATIGLGDVLVLNADTGEVLTGGSNTVITAPKIMFAVGTGNGQTRLSPVFAGHLLEGADKEAYAAAIKHKMAIGYDGASAPTLPVENSKLYSGVLVYSDSLRLIANRQVRTEFEYTSSASADGFEIAAGLVENFNLQEEKYADASIITDGTPTTIDNVTCTVTRNSDIITFSGTDATLTLAAGEYVRLGDDLGTFKVKAALSSTKFQLTSKVYGPSQVLSAGTAAELATVAKFGVKFVGIEIPTKTINKYENVVFEIGCDEGLLDVVPSLLAQGFKGTGLGIQVLEEELKCIGKHGVTDHMDFRTNKDINYYAQKDKNYNLITLTGKVKVRGDLQENRYLPVELSIAFSTDAATQRDAVLTILNPWLTSADLPTISF